jgi:hypothetical protein
VPRFNALPNLAAKPATPILPAPVPVPVPADDDVDVVADDALLLLLPVDALLLLALLVLDALLASVTLPASGGTVLSIVVVFFNAFLPNPWIDDSNAPRPAPLADVLAAVVLFIADFDEGAGADGGAGAGGGGGGGGGAGMTDCTYYCCF